MSVRLRLETNDVKIKRELRRGNKQIITQINGAILDLGRKMRTEARLRAPYRTGKLSKAIALVPRKGPYGIIERDVISRNTANQYGQKRTGNWANFNLPYWAAVSPKAKYHFWSGDYNYMKQAHRKGVAESGRTVRAYLQAVKFGKTL